MTEEEFTQLHNDWHDDLEILLQRLDDSIKHEQLWDATTKSLLDQVAAHCGNEPGNED